MYTYKFNTIADYLAVASKGKMKNGYADFHGTDTLAEALDLATHGWIEGATQAKALAAGLAESFQPKLATGGQWRKVLTGGSVRVPAYLQGRPDCFLQYKQVQDTKFVHIVYVGSASGDISTASIIKKGVVLAAVIDLLEGHRIRVKLDLAYGTADKTELYVKLKDHNESLDLDRIVFFTAHPAALRQIKFNFYDTKRADLGGIGTGQGAPCDVTDRGDIYFTHQHAHNSVWGTPESTFEFVKAQLKLKGIEL